MGFGDSPYVESTWTYNQDWSDVEVYLPFDQSIPLEPGDVYFAAIINENQSTSQLAVSAQPDSDTDGSTGSYARSGSGEYAWFD